MKTIDIGDYQKYTRMFAPTVEFDEAYTFYYDETNNVTKFVTIQRINRKKSKKTLDRFLRDFASILLPSQ